MYEPLLLLHSWDRWIIVVLALLLVISAAAKAGRGAWSSADDRLSLFLTIAVDVQVLLGLLLYFVATPHFSRLLHGAGSVMSDRIARYWAVEHLFGMLLAIVLIHIGRAKMKRSEVTRKAKVTLTFVGLALLLILLSLPWSFMPYARPLFRLGQ
jgi:hypothetical protein